MLLKIKKNYFIIIVTFLFLYFFFNLLDGERGLVSYFEKKKILTKLKHKKISLTEQIEDLEHNKSLLTTDIDLDYIEILIREKFLFGKKDDKIFLIKE